MGEENRGMAGTNPSKQVTIKCYHSETSINQSELFTSKQMESLKLINQIRKAGRGGLWKKIGKVSIVKLRITMKYIFKKEEICKRCISCKVKLIMFSVFAMMSRWHNKPIAFG